MEFVVRSNRLQQPQAAVGAPHDDGKSRAEASLVTETGFDSGKLLFELVDDFLDLSTGNLHDVTTSRQRTHGGGNEYSGHGGRRFQDFAFCCKASKIREGDMGRACKRTPIAS